MPASQPAFLRRLFILIPMLLICVLVLRAAPGRAAAYGVRGQTTPQCNVIYWIYTNGYSQIALLNHSWKELHNLQWTPDNSTTFKVRWRNGKTQSFTLRQPGKNLKQVSFFCQGDGFIKIRVTDCQTKQPLYNALISDITGKQFRGFPTGKDGWGVVPCSCYNRLPQTVTIKVQRSGYQSKQGKVLFSDKVIKSYSICLSKASASPSASPSTAPSTAQTWVEWQGHRYLVVTNKVTWPQAQAYAQKLGGHLVTISSKAENEFVTNLAHDKGVGRTYWIGFTDQGSEGKWRWANGQKVTYTNWYHSEPNNSKGRENCCEVGWHSKYTWNDAPCEETLGFVVEIDQSESYWGKPRVLKTAAYSWKGSKKDYARISNNAVIEVGMGNNKWGYGYAGALLAGAKGLNVSIISAPKSYERHDRNSFAGFVLDYGVGDGFGKRVYLGIGMMDTKRWGGFDDNPASPKARQFVNLGPHSAYYLDLSKWAPTGWNGKTWFYVGVANIGAGKYLKAKITSLR